MIRWQLTSWLLWVSVFTVVALDQLSRYLVQFAPQSVVAGLLLLLAMNQEGAIWGQVFSVFKFREPVTGKHILFSLSSSTLSTPLAIHLLGATGQWSWYTYAATCLAGMGLLWMLGGDAALVIMCVGVTQGNISRLFCTPTAIMVPAIAYALNIQFMEIKDYVEEWPGAKLRVKIWICSVVGAVVALWHSQS